LWACWAVAPTSPRGEGTQLFTTATPPGLIVPLAVIAPVTVIAGTAAPALNRESSLSMLPFIVASHGTSPCAGLFNAMFGVGVFGMLLSQKHPVPAADSIRKPLFAWRIVGLPFDQTVLHH